MNVMFQLCRTLGLQNRYKNELIRVWPHEHILGGQNRQRLAYDQITMAQFVQGFVKDILDEQDVDLREHMLQYLGDIMEDASDFSWQSAKAYHAVILYVMERGKVLWDDTIAIDRLRRTYDQKHQQNGKQNWGYRNSEKKPWFCKNFKTTPALSEKITKLGGGGGGNPQRHLHSLPLTGKAITSC